ncbi:unnamed protein product [Arctogadus glacialis]
MVLILVRVVVLLVLHSRFIPPGFSMPLSCSLLFFVFLPDASAEIDENDEDDEEMYFNSHCEKCKAAQQSPEYRKVTPRKISKWSFQVQLEGEGTYECSATGLVFEVSEQALVRYSVLSWSEFSEFLKDSWRPAGSIYDVNVVNKDPSVLKFIHLPHSLCLPDPEHELSFHVLHVKEQHGYIESAVVFTASHVIWRVSSLCPVGSIIPSSQHEEDHGAVLVYKEQDHQEQFCFHVFMASNNESEIKAIEAQVLSSGKKMISIYKSATFSPLNEKVYRLISNPVAEIIPLQQQFCTEAVERKGFFEAIFDQPLTFKLSLMDQGQKLWTAKITKGDWEGKKVLKPRKRTRAEQHTGQKKKSRCEVMQNNNPLLPDTHRGQALTTKQLLHVAKTLGQEWEEVAINLDLSIPDLDGIKQGENNNVNMIKLKMLELWKRRTIEDKREATAQDLLRGLKDMSDLPGETRNLLNVLSPV